MVWYIKDIPNIRIIIKQMHSTFNCSSQGCQEEFDNSNDWFKDGDLPYEKMIPFQINICSDNEEFAWEEMKEDQMNQVLENHKPLENGETTKNTPVHNDEEPDGNSKGRYNNLYPCIRNGLLKTFQEKQILEKTQIENKNDFDWIQKFFSKKKKTTTKHELLQLFKIKDLSGDIAKLFLSKTIKRNILLSPVQKSNKVKFMKKMDTFLEEFKLNWRKNN